MGKETLSLTKQILESPLSDAITLFQGSKHIAAKPGYALEIAQRIQILSPWVDQSTTQTQTDLFAILSPRIFGMLSQNPKMITSKKEYKQQIVGSLQNAELKSLQNYEQHITRAVQKDLGIDVQSKVSSIAYNTILKITGSTIINPKLQEMSALRGTTQCAWYISQIHAKEGKAPLTKEWLITYIDKLYASYQTAKNNRLA